MLAFRVDVIISSLEGFFGAIFSRTKHKWKKPSWGNCKSTFPLSQNSRRRKEVWFRREDNFVLKYLKKTDLIITIGMMKEMVQRSFAALLNSHSRGSLSYEITLTPSPRKLWAFQKTTLIHLVNWEL